MQEEVDSGPWASRQGHGPATHLLMILRNMTGFLLPFVRSLGGMAHMYTLTHGQKPHNTAFGALL